MIIKLNLYRTLLNKWLQSASHNKKQHSNTEICTMYKNTQSIQSKACENKNIFSNLKVFKFPACRNAGGRVLHREGARTEKARSPLVAIRDL